MKKMKFEQAMKKLEEIVAQLETGELDLEESLKLFEEGIMLSRFCQEQLQLAEGRVQSLMKTLEGEWQLQDVILELTERG